LIANQFRSAGNWPMGAAMALILAVMFLVTYIIVLKLLSLLRLAPGRRYH
jgi:spermidine/putrescine transport system permease protein